MVIAFGSPLVAMAQIAPECRGVTMASDYDEVAQQDFMANYGDLPPHFRRFTVRFRMSQGGVPLGWI